MQNSQTIPKGRKTQLKPRGLQGHLRVFAGLCVTLLSPAATGSTGTTVPIHSAASAFLDNCSTERPSFSPSNCFPFGHEIMSMRERLQILKFSCGLPESHKLSWSELVPNSLTVGNFQKVQSELNFRLCYETLFLKKQKRESTEP